MYESNNAHVCKCLLGVVMHIRHIIYNVMITI